MLVFNWAFWTALDLGTSISSSTVKPCAQSLLKAPVSSNTTLIWICTLHITQARLRMLPLMFQCLSLSICNKILKLSDFTRMLSVLIHKCLQNIFIIKCKELISAKCEQAWVLWWNCLVLNSKYEQCILFFTWISKEIVYLELRHVGIFEC